MDIRNLAVLLWSIVRFIAKPCTTQRGGGAVAAAGGALKKASNAI